MMKEREHNIRDSRSLQNLMAISLRYRQLVIILKAGYGTSSQSEGYTSKMANNIIILFG